ncbi:hypothetical protein HS041_26780 [Planomonospora sp. ID67723]|uniref:hypothetical protein n=1 Tax=Planomonospora sp. ID67723 TaxID=2738134 RepID=UPI0018C37655|nr:hypothetical protein [Planomonospora sp. ID67723]MBG0831356.1 hypothetical protein [Planomonospora sp. ID67723]
MDSNHPGWSTAAVPVIMGDPGRPEPSRKPANGVCRTGPLIAPQAAAAIAPFAAEPADLR